MTPEQQLVDEWSKNANLFVEEALGIKTLTFQQRQAFDELTSLVWSKIKKSEGQALTAKEEEYAGKWGVSIMSGMGTGKDAFAAMATMWFLGCFPDSLVPCTAPTEHQLNDAMWRELSVWKNSQDCKIKGWFTWQREKFFLTAAKGETWYAMPRTANPKKNDEELASTLKGLHADYMMIVVDEADGVPEQVFLPLEGTMTGTCNFALLIFNPTRPTGFAAESQTIHRDKWVCVRWNAEDSDLVNPASITAKEEKYGRDSNYFRVTVLGLPPTSTKDALISWEWAIDAVDRELTPTVDDPQIFGIDVGAGGDESCIVRKHGASVLGIHTTDTGDSETLTDWCINLIQKHEPAYVFVDQIGVGWAIVGNLKARLRGTPTIVIGVTVSTSPSDKQRFHNLRDELSWRVRSDFENKAISIPNDYTLLAEMTSLKYVEQGEKIKVQAKKELKESPNRFDALMLTYFKDATKLRGIKSGGFKAVKRNPPPAWRTV